MTVQEIYQYCEDLANKDQKGNAFGPDQFNNTAKFVSAEMFQAFFKKAQEASVTQGLPLGEVLFAMSDLRSFIVEEGITTRAVGVITPTHTSTIAPYPAGYRHWISMIANGVPVEIRPYLEINKYRGGVLNGNPDENPLAFEGSAGFEIIPNDISNLSLTYLRHPATPYYDFCVTSDDLKVFMPFGSRIRYVPQLDVFALYDLNGEQLVLDVYKEGVSNFADVYYSKTVEFDWTETMHPAIADKILERMGVNLRAPEVVQWAQSQSAK